MMNVVQISKFGGTEVLENKKLNVPEPKNKEIVVKIKFAGFNPVACKLRSGAYGGKLPMILGEDFSGVVSKVGEDVESFKQGDKVYGMSYVGCSNGSNAEYTSVIEELLQKKPENISFEEASSVPLAALTAYKAIVASGAVKKGDTVFLAGIGGGVGSFAVQFLRYLKVKKIYTVAKNKESKEFIEKELKIPSENIILYEGLSVGNLKKELIKANNNSHFDSTIDFVGGYVKELCIELVKWSGRLVTILPEDEKFKVPGWGGTVFMKNMTVTQICVDAELHSGDRENFKIYPEYLGKITKMIEEGILEMPVINNVGALDAKTVQKAHSLLEKGRVKGKLVMKVE